MRMAISATAKKWLDRHELAEQLVIIRFLRERIGAWNNQGKDSPKSRKIGFNEYDDIFVLTLDFSGGKWLDVQVG